MVSLMDKALAAYEAQQEAAREKVQVDLTKRVLRVLGGKALPPHAVFSPEGATVLIDGIEFSAYGRAGAVNAAVVCPYCGGDANTGIVRNIVDIGYLAANAACSCGDDDDVDEEA